jgi:hypothetical protein
MISVLMVGLKERERERERENAKLMECYLIKKIYWERSNHKCLIVIKERISESIREQS